MQPLPNNAPTYVGSLTISGAASPSPACYNGTTGLPCAPGDASCPCVYVASSGGSTLTRTISGTPYALMCPPLPPPSAAQCPASAAACVVSATSNSPLTGTLTAGGKCLDLTPLASATATYAGTAVLAKPCSGAASQQWQLRSDGTIFNNVAGMCMNVAGLINSNGALVNVAACNPGQGGQNFKPPTALPGVITVSKPLGGILCLTASASPDVETCTTGMATQSFAFNIARTVVQCEDDAPSQCPALASSGQCTSNPTYMLFHCRKSCGVCVPS